jgi:hypothetical protein
MISRPDTPDRNSKTNCPNKKEHLAPELSLNARNSSDQLISVKDPLTSTGGRAALRNDILKDAAKSVNTGKRPEYILDLMQTPKGYQMVRETMTGTPQSTELFRSFERLFVEDIVTSVTDATGSINFSKARQIFKNPEMLQVVEQIGGESLIRRFKQLESFSNNFEKNMSLYSKPEAQSITKSIVGSIATKASFAAILHALHMPWSVIAGLGLASGGVKVTKLTYNALQKKILSNPRAIHYIERVSQAKTTTELAKQLPRLIAEIDKPQKDELE